MQLAFEYPMQPGHTPIARPHLSEQVRHCVRNSLSYPRQNEPRVIYDLQQCLTHYPTLRPLVDEYKSQEHQLQQQHPHQNNHDAAPRLASLQGTLPITFRGAQYHIPVRIWVMPYHPVGPPQIFVVPTSTMCIPPGHPNVDVSSGQVYLPYLSHWRTPASNLCEALSATTFAFSSNPPVVARGPPQQPQPQQNHRPQSYPSFSSPQTHMYPNRVHHLSQPPPPPRRHPPPPPPPPPPHCHTHQSASPVMGLAEADDRAQLIASLSARTHARLHSKTASVRAEYSALKVRQADAQACVSELSVERAALETLEAKHAALKAWHAENVPDGRRREGENNDMSNNKNCANDKAVHNKDVGDRVCVTDIDAALQPRTMHDAQALAAASAELAATDTLDLLDDAVSASALTPDNYVRLVRRVARDLFLQRATREALRKGHPDGLFVDELPHAAVHSVGEEPLR